MKEKIITAELKEPSWEEIAYKFHETYEGLSPFYGYITKEETRVFDPESNNGKLMIEVCKKVVSELLSKQTESMVERIRELESVGNPEMMQSLEDRFFNVPLDTFNQNLKEKTTK